MTSARKSTAYSKGARVGKKKAEGKVVSGKRKKEAAHVSGKRWRIDWGKLKHYAGRTKGTQFTFEVVGPFTLLCVGELL